MYVCIYLHVNGHTDFIVYVIFNCKDTYIQMQKRQPSIDIKTY